MRRLVFLLFIVLVAGCLDGGITGRVVDAPVGDGECRVWSGTVEIVTPRGVNFLAEWTGTVVDESVSGVFSSLAYFNGTWGSGATGVFWGDDADSGVKLQGTWGGTITDDAFDGLVIGSIIEEGDRYGFKGTMAGTCKNR